MLRLICEKVKKFQHFLLDILYRNYHFKKAGAKFAPPVQETVNPIWAERMEKFAFILVFLQLFLNCYLL